MIDFRYHVVSLTAVFLALTVGVVLGTTALKGPILETLRGQVRHLTTENQSLRSDVRGLRDQTNGQEAFADAVAPSLLAGRLAGKRVALVVGTTVPKGVADRLGAEVKTAGAAVTATVALADAFTDPRHAADLRDFAARLPAGVQVPTTDDAVAQAATLLGVVLARNRQPAVSPADRTAVLQGFESLGVVTVDGPANVPADAALVVVGPPAVGNQAKSVNLGYATLVRQFAAERVSTVVAAAVPDGDGNLAITVRRDDQLAKQVSTVDDAATAAGRVSAVLALAEQAAGDVGHYGVGNLATKPVPLKAP